MTIGLAGRDRAGAQRGRQRELAAGTAKIANLIKTEAAAPDSAGNDPKHMQWIGETDARNAPFHFGDGIACY